ncbi:MAG: substrate-binding domain-containing protein [Chloroflexota bacterium]|nr:substrate-binding domain-containing protein [Chloroflexota bacterium]
MSWRAGAVCVLIVVLTACMPSSVVPTPTAAPLAASPEPLRLVYSESTAPLIQAWVPAYQNHNSAVELVLLERAMALAEQALINGDMDVALLAQLPSESAVPTYWSEPVAREGLAIVVNPQNGLPGLTEGQLRELFQGRVEDWARWEGLPGLPVIVSREEGAGEYAYFQAQVMGDFPVTLTALLAPSSEAVLKMVGEKELAVGYLSTAWLDGRVRPLPLDGVSPSREMLASGVYPLTRELYLVMRGEPQGASRDFAQWVLGAEGQRIVAEQGWVTVER